MRSLIWRAKYGRPYPHGVGARLAGAVQGGGGAAPRGGQKLPLADAVAASVDNLLFLSPLFRIVLSLGATQSTANPAPACAAAPAAAPPPAAVTRRRRARPPCPALRSPRRRPATRSRPGTAAARPHRPSRGSAPGSGPLPRARRRASRARGGGTASSPHSAASDPVLHAPRHRLHQGPCTRRPYTLNPNPKP